MKFALAFDVRTGTDFDFVFGDAVERDPKRVVNKKAQLTGLRGQLRFVRVIY